MKVSIQISWVLGSQGYAKSSSTHDYATLIFFEKKRRKIRRRSTFAREAEDPQTTLSHCLTSMKRATLLKKPMSLLTHQQSRTNGPSGQDIDEFRLIWE